jgi:hypothetical protein
MHLLIQNEIPSDVVAKEERQIHSGPLCLKKQVVQRSSFDEEMFEASTCSRIDPHPEVKDSLSRKKIKYKESYM